MTVSPPTLVASTGSTANVTSRAASPSAAVPVGTVLAVSVVGNGAFGATVTDSAGNTYTQVGTSTANLANNVLTAALFVAVVTTALTTSSTITATRATGTTSGSLAFEVESYSGVDTTTPTRGAAAVNNSGTVAGSTTASTAAVTPTAGDTVIAAVGLKDGSTGFTAGAGFTIGNATSSTVTNPRDLWSIYQQAAATGAVTPSASWTTAKAWAMIAAVLRAAPVVTTAGTATLALTASATVREVEVTAGTATLALTASATVREVEVTAGTATLALTASATVREVEVTAGTATLVLTASATVREVEVTAGTATLVLSATAAAFAVEVTAGTATLVLTATAAAVAVAAGTTIVVTLGDAFSQTWVTGRDADEDLVNSAGAVLDGLTASWAAADLFSQPEPVALSMGVYLPAAAGAPAPDQGLPVSVLITPPGYVAGAGYDPLLDFRGRVTDGEAEPWREGLRYSLTAVDANADRGEAKIGGRKWGQEYTQDRVQRIAKALAGRGITLVHPWDADQLTDQPNGLTDPAGWSAFNEAHWPVMAMDGTMLAPTWPVRAAEAVPATDMLDQLIQARPGWVSTLGADALGTVAKDRRHAGAFDLFEEYDKPRATDWRRFWMAPYVAAGIDTAGKTVHRVLWTSCRVAGDAGLPFRAQLVGGLLQLTPRAQLGERPPESRHGAWIPASAVPRASIKWAVDRTAYPNRVQLSGFWVDWQSPQPSTWLWWQDRYWERPERVRDRGPNEAQLDLSYLSDPATTEDTVTTTAPLNEGDWIANTRLGFWGDSLPRYGIKSFEILTKRIPDPRDWPRLFPDPRWGGAFGGHLGRFLCIYGIKPEWNPRGQRHYFGQLLGASLMVSRGQVTLTATITQRRPGPNGPVGTPPAPDSVANARLRTDQLAHGPTPTAAIKWTDVQALYPTLTVDQLDPTTTALDLWLTLPS